MVKKTKEFKLKNLKEKFTECYLANKDSIWRYCLFMTQNYSDAKELLSETLFQAYCGFSKLNSNEAFLSYIFTIASRTFYKSIKHRGKFEEDFDFEKLTYNVPLPDQMLDISILRENMNKLSDDNRETLILAEIEGFSRKEIAKILGISEETVKSRLYRSKKQLAELMGVKNEYTIR